MGVANAAGYPAAAGFIPEIWSGTANEKFYAACCAMAISNSKWEGEIKDKGDTVHIYQVPDMTISDYVKGQVMEIETPDSDVIDLVINRAKKFAFTCDDIDRLQSSVKLMDAWGNDAGEKMKIAIDKDFFANVYADVAASNKGATAGAISKGFGLGTTGSPIQISKSNVLDYIVDLGNVLDESNVPETDRWLVIPAWMAGMIKKSDLKDASITGDGKSILRNGRLGMIDRFTLYSSNNLTVVSDSGKNCVHVLGGHTCAITFASQMTKVETLRSERYFGDIVRGLNVYGFKTVKGDGLADLYCYK